MLKAVIITFLCLRTLHAMKREPEKLKRETASMEEI
jgi:hypothetical protein